MSTEMENQPEETQTETPATEVAVETQEATPTEAAPVTEQKPQVSDEDLKKTLECLLFITDRPLPTRELTKACGLSVKESHRVGALLGQIRDDLEQRGAPYQAIEVADGWQMATRTGYAPYVRKIFSERMTLKLSTAAHETLAIVAYKQPITRAEIEDVRGVEVIAALETLLEKRLIKVVGRKETVGRPLMYGTTVEFLRHFGLRSLEDMPPLDTFTPKQEITAASETPGEPAGETVTPTPETLAQAETEIEEAKKESLWPSDEDTSSGQ
jgi:segregation and condensation protein B